MEDTTIGTWLCIVIYFLIQMNWPQVLMPNDISEPGTHSKWLKFEVL